MQPSNVLHISTLSEGWCDKDHVILHACFQLLTDFVEKELSDSWWIDWDQDEEHQKAKEEIDILYSWWKQKLSKPEPSSFREDINDYSEENDMLRRLINVRMYLWT